MSETNQFLAMLALMASGGVAVLLWSQPSIYRRLMCRLRGGHAWRYFDDDRDERQCTKCGCSEYAGIEDVDGNKIWFDR